MKIKLIHLIIVYIAILFLLALISDPLNIFKKDKQLGQTVTQSEDLINNIYHFSAYFILGILAALYFISSPNKIMQKRFILLTIIFSLIIASTDELIQILTPDRMPDFIDLIYDFFGALSSQLFFYKPKSD